VKIAWLPEARKTAEMAMNYEQANAWAGQLVELTSAAEKN
jgi:hypothetical protein